jgi:RNase H-fold protein (predicted Holliday junction resolvase)
MDDAIGSQAKQVQKVARRVMAELGLSIEYVSEQLTSYAAKQMTIAKYLSIPK